MKIISAIQFCPKLARCTADVMDNIRRLEPLINQAGSLGTELLVLPELFATGYSFLNHDEAMTVAERADGQTFRSMSNVARNFKTYVSWGYVESDEHGHLYNSASLVDPTGKLISSYRKINLFSSDFLWATPGEEAAPVVETAFGKTGLVICRDLRDKIPKNIPRMAVDGPPLFKKEKVDLVIACVAWGKGSFPSSTWMDFSVNNKCTLVVANRWGVETRDDCGNYSHDFGHGGSAIIEPNWTVHTNGLKFGMNCVVTAAF